MPRWADLAVWHGPTPNQGGRILAHKYVLLHIADGTFAGTIAWQRNADSNVSSHFIVAKDGRAAQMVDTAVQAWTQKAGNPYCLSIEHEGYAGDALTPHQIEASAQLLARAHRVHGVPLQVTGTVGIPGLGHHSMGYESGVDWGHPSCPGDRIKAQKPAIASRARRIVSKGATMLFLAQVEGDPSIYLADGFQHRHITPDAYARYQALGLQLVIVDSPAQLSSLCGVRLTLPAEQ